MNTETRQHPPGPWTLREGVFIDAPAEKQIIHIRGVKNDPETRATANFIITACNSHAAMLAALEKIVTELSQHTDAHYTRNNPVWYALEHARAAIVAAKGEAQ